MRARALWSDAAAELVPRERLARVERRGLQQLALAAALRDADAHLGLAVQREQLLVELAVLGLDRHEDLAGDVFLRRVGVELFDDAGDERRRLDVFDLVDDEPLAADDSPLAHVEHLHARFEEVLVETDEVEVFLARRDHLLAFDRLADARELVAHAGRELELELVGRLGHPLFEALDDRVVLAVEEVEEVVDELVVVVVVDVADARRRALLDVRVEARAAEPVVPVELGLRARADRERAQQEVERLADRVRVRVRAEVADALALRAAQHHRPGPVLVERDREVRVALVVLQADVEAGLVPLDEVELQEEGLDLVLGDDPLDRLRGADHLAGALGEQLGLQEVVREAAAEALGLPDVDDPALAVEELVRPGRVGDRTGLGAGNHAPIVAGAGDSQAPACNQACSCRQRSSASLRIFRAGTHAIHLKDRVWWPRGAGRWRRAGAAGARRPARRWRRR